MNNLRKLTFLFLFLCLLSRSFINAQAPSVTAQVGYPIGTSAKQVAYGNSKYVLLADHNWLYQSSNATSWNQINPTGLSSTTLNYIVYGASLFVVVGNNGVIQTSADGITWTTRTSGSANNLLKVYFVNSKFFAVGYNRTLLTSNDGITWTTVTINTGTSTDFFLSLAYGNGWYVLSARSNTGGSSAIVYRSTTAANNTWSSATDVPAWNGTNRIQFLKDKFWAFMIGNRMFTSTDGGTWTEITNSVVLTQPNSTTTSWNASHQIFNGVWDGTKYSFYGSSQYYSGYGSTFTSTDGLNFTLLNKTAYIVPQESVILNSKYFVCGNEGFVTSTDGLTYSHSGYTISDMIKTPNKYVAVGMLGGGQMYNSIDFNTWTNRSPAAVGDLYTVAYDGTTILAAGDHTIFSSTNDGDTWTNVYTNATEGFTAMAYGNGRFVVGGYDASGAFIRYSTNGGQTWTTANTDYNWYMKIKYINNKFFALAMNNDDYTGRIMYSSDGISWSDVTPNLGIEVYYYKDVAFDGSKYHVLGIESSGYVPVGFFTVSTTTPANAVSYANKAVCNNTPGGVVLGGNWDQGVLDYANGKFTGAVIDATTGQDYIIYSNDGSSWTAIAQNSYSTIMASYLSGTTARMVGRSNAFFTVDYGLTLPVSLTEFSGKLLQSSVKLNWATTSEQNSKQFIVQHSTDGNHWNQIGMVAAAGNSSTKKEYDFIHTTPVAGVNFYRLLQQDFDERSTTSRVVTIITGKDQISWYPNPVVNELVIRTTNNEPGHIIFFNVSGQAVKRVSTTGIETHVDLSGLPRGTYMAEVWQGKQKQRLTVTKN